LRATNRSAQRPARADHRSPHQRHPAARGESPAAFDGRCDASLGCVAPLKSSRFSPAFARGAAPVSVRRRSSPRTAVWHRQRRSRSASNAGSGAGTAKIAGCSIRKRPACAAQEAPHNVIKHSW